MNPPTAFGWRPRRESRGPLVAISPADLTQEATQLTRLLRGKTSDSRFGTRDRPRRLSVNPLGRTHGRAHVSKTRTSRYASRRLNDVGNRRQRPKKHLWRRKKYSGSTKKYSGGEKSTRGGEKSTPRGLKSPLGDKKSTPGVLKSARGGEKSTPRALFRTPGLEKSNQGELFSAPAGCRRTGRLEAGAPKLPTASAWPARSRSSPRSRCR